ncbi:MULTISPECIES: patatin-like phospholipase family protein [Halobacteriovorax]|uniref:PNPLA domain-containing protein n=1 Tax=Halobacteriovorax vibrionivorans TaxID=2152716 RepID=A0ABY0IJA5_9BACT|nr:MULTISPECIES: patatin-like phospholipase family protein [Halobacteriovorax]RZF23036.1 hypothetical protein DAY19_04495 [Halobacteriovorax vibrionivorans]TGD49334.1 hypothetical protein EP118_00590 [Halobacteriovorax sp. Y22]
MNRIDMENLRSKKTALVLSGGVVKAAAWHLGVSWALHDLGFTFKHNHSDVNPDFEISTYVGSSAGALISLYLASGHSPMDIIEAFLHKNKHGLKPITYRDMLSIKRPKLKPHHPNLYDPLDGFPGMLKKVLSPIISISGLFSTQGLHDYIVDNIIKSNNFDDYDADLFIIATQLDHSRKVIFSRYNYPNPSHDPTAHYYTDIPIAEAATASMSVPPFYTPYPIHNNTTNKTDFYIDGEIRETLSTHVAVDNKCDYIISSWTHTPYHYQDEIGSLANYGLPAICTQAIYLMIQKKIIDSRARRIAAQDIIDTVNQYMINEKFSNDQRRHITSIIERKLNYDPNVKLIDIYPTHEDFNLFFADVFSLNPKKMTKMLEAGYKRTMDIFNNKEFEA